jgi:lysyl-tRNA synthetase class 2
MTRDRRAVPLEPVESYALEAVGYDRAAQELYVRFPGGSTYVYHQVPEMVYRLLLAADSKGGYLNRMIKPHFSCDEVY